MELYYLCYYRFEGFECLLVILFHFYLIEIFYFYFCLFEILSDDFFEIGFEFFSDLSLLEDFILFVLESLGI